MSDEQKSSMWRKWGSLILGGLLLFLAGLEVGAEAMRRTTRDTEAMLERADEKVNEATQSLNASQIEMDRFKNAYVVTVQQLADLQKELNQARSAAVPIRRAESTNSCMISNQSQGEQSGAFTVLYEAGGASLNLSLLPLRGAPRVSLSGAQLGPRWIVPGKVQPEMLGDARQAMYYFYDARNATWQGPFAPTIVVPYSRPQ